MRLFAYNPPLRVWLPEYRNFSFKCQFFFFPTRRPFLLKSDVDLKSRHSFVGYSPKVAKFYPNKVLPESFRVHIKPLVRSFFCASFEPACLVLDIR